MNYTEVFNKAWKYVWKHKILWLFALFAGSLVGVSFGFPAANGGSGMQYRFSGDDWLNRMSPFMRTRIPQLWEDVRSASPWMWVWIIIAIVLVALLFSAIHLFSSTAGRGGLIKGLLLAEDKQDSQPLRFKEAWQGMKPYFWRLLLLRLFIGVAVAILSAILVELSIVITILTLGVALCVIIPLLLLVIPMGWLVKAVIANASIAMIDENLGVFKAIARSWKIVSSNVWSMLHVMLVNSLIGIGTVLAILFAFLLASTPLFLTGLFGGEITTGIWVVVGILLVLAFILAIFISMWSNTLAHGIFVIAYRRIKDQVTTPFGRTELSTPASTVAADEANMAGEVDLSTDKDPEVALGNEPASKEPDEDSQEG
ncbi:MAG: hypothetical protein WBI14_06130 [Anaerolineaceae bacterium]